MPQVKTPTAHNLREHIGAGFILLLWAVISVVIINTIDNQQYMKISLLLVFLVMVFLLAWHLFKSKKAFVCPDCKSPIPETVKTSGKPGEPIMHYCKKCDVLWHTGNIPSN